MAHIYKTDVTNNRFVYISDQDPSFEHNIQLTENLLTYKFINKDTGVSVIQFKIDMQTVRSNNRFTDQIWYGISDGILTSTEHTDGEVTLSSNDIVSLLDYSSVYKQKALINVTDSVDPTKTSKVPVRFFVPSKTSNFNDCIFQVAVPLAGDIVNTITVETNNTNTVDIESDYTWKSAFANITAVSSGSTTAGEDVVVDITVDDTSIEAVYLEQVVGVLDKTKVKLTNGSGSFKVLTSTLESGDVVEVKIGYKLFSNKTTFTKQLV